MKRRKNLAELDQDFVWHPFTQMQDWEKENPLVIVKGKGSYLYDSDGNKYLDGVSSLWVNVHGHRKKEIDRAVKKQIDKIAHSTLLGLANEPSILLAKELIQIAPKGLAKVFYSDSGSTAVEVALKMAFQYWQNQTAGPQDRRTARLKTKFITLENAYHGDTIGAVSVGGIDTFHKIYKPLLFKSIKVKPDAKEIEAAMKKHYQEVGAVIMEPLIQAAAGMLLEPKGLLRKVRQLCNKYNILMIVDEVATGFGRTGKMFACEHEGVTPDLMCIAKGISGGYLPVAATLTTQKIYDGFKAPYKEQKTFFHGHTYTGNPLGCAAALANLEIFRKEKVLQKLQDKIRCLAKKLQGFRRLPQVKEVRQLGMMAGIELIDYPWEEKAAVRVCMHCRKQGVIIRPLGNVIVLMPPLSISKNEIDLLLKAVYKSIEELL